MPGSRRPVRLGYAIGTGAVRFAVAVVVFCSLFVAGTILHQAVNGYEGWVNDPGSPSDVLLTGARILLVLLLLGLPVVVLGAVVGALEVPLARRLQPGPAAALGGVVVGGITLLVAPWPFADVLHGTFEHLLYWLAPSAFLGLAAAWQAYRLSRRAHSA